MIFRIVGSSHFCCVFLFVNTCLVDEKNVVKSLFFGCGMMKLLCSSEMFHYLDMKNIFKISDLKMEKKFFLNFSSSQ